MSHPHAAEVTADHADDWSPHAPETFHELDRMGKAATGLLGLATLTHLLSTLSDWNTYSVVNKYLGGVPNVEDADLNRADAIARMTSIPNVVISVAAAVVFVLWLWRARLNSEVFCQADHRHSHGWVLTSWFCPGANLLYPRQIVADVYAASHPDTPVWADDLRRYRRAPIIGLWWTCWLGAMILDVAVRRVLMWVDPTVPVLRMIAISATASVLLTASSAGLAAVIIKRVTWMQTSRPWIPWWDHREESRGSSRQAVATDAFPYAEAQRHESPYADRYEASSYAEQQHRESVYADDPYADLRPEPMVAMAPAQREPQLVNTTQPLNQPVNWSENRPVAEFSGMPEPTGPAWNETRPMTPAAEFGTRPEQDGPAWNETRPMVMPAADLPNRPESPALGLPGSAGGIAFDRPWQQTAENPAPQQPSGDEPQPSSPFAALVESWREQAEAEEAAKNGYLQSPGYLEPSAPYLEPTGFVGPLPDPAPEPVEPWQRSEPQPETRWSSQPQWNESETRWSESEPESDLHWSETAWTPTPWSEPLNPEPQWNETHWNEQPAAQWNESAQPPWSHHEPPSQPPWQAQPDLPVQPQWQTQPGWQTQSERNPQPESPPQPNWQARPDSPAQPEWQTRSESPGQPDWQARPDSAPQPDWQARPDSPGQPEWQTRSESPGQPEWQARPGSPAQPDWQARPEPSTQPPWQTQSEWQQQEPQARPEWQVQPEPQTRPEWQAQPEFQGQPQWQAQAEQRAQPPSPQPEWQAQPEPEWQAQPEPEWRGQPRWTPEPDPASPPRLTVVPPLPAPEPGVGPTPIADPAPYAGAPSEPWRETASADPLSPSAPIPAPAPAPGPAPIPRHLARRPVDDPPQTATGTSYVAPAPFVAGPPPAVQALIDQSANEPTTQPPAPAQPPAAVHPAPAAQPPAAAQPPPQGTKPGGQPPREAAPAPRTHPHRRRWAAGPG